MMDVFPVSTAYDNQITEMASDLDCRVNQLKAVKRLAVQPRMGFAEIAAMGEGLKAVKDSVEGAIGTITIDAYTRVGQVEKAQQAIENGSPLNGFPITVHAREAVREMLAAVHSAQFPIQVRHGSAFPQHIFEAAAECGITAIEGGPVSYNLPYSRASLGKTVPAWREAADFWARSADRNGTQTHIETFGGALLGQLCPPSLLVAVSTLEALFFAARGIQGVSLSLAQGSSFDQDVGALIAMDRIIDRRLATIDTHKVFYNFMGQFPVTPVGAEALIRASARIAAIGGAERLIVKTAAEARGIPTVEENVTALGWARESADESQAAISADAQAWADCIEAEAECMIEAVLNLSPDVGDALIGAFASGLLDVPYCMHPDNRGQTRATVDPQSGAVVWTCTGALPIAAPKTVRLFATEAEKSAQFERAIEAVRRLYDDAQNSHEMMETE